MIHLDWPSVRDIARASLRFGLAITGIAVGWGAADLYVHRADFNLWRD